MEKTLNDLKPNQKATVVGFTKDNAVTRRLMELGFTYGAAVTCIRNAPLKDPIQFLVGNANISLYRSEASLVKVRKQIYDYY